MLAPRMTTVQRSAISSPAKGLLVYDTDLNSLYHYNGSVWAAVGAGGGGLSLPFNASQHSAMNLFEITNSGMGDAIRGITTNEFGRAVTGIANSEYGYGLYGYTNQTNAIAVYGEAGNGTAVKGYSVSGLGLDARSTNNTAIKASIILGANQNPVILATHAGGGIGVDASSNSGTAIKGLSESGIGVRGESSNGTGVLGYSNNFTGMSAGTLGGTAMLASAVGGTAIKGSSSSGYALDVSGKVKIAGGNTNPATGAVLTSMDASGNAVWKSNRVAFSVSGYNSNLLNVNHNTHTTVHLFNEEFDVGNNYTLYTGNSPSFGHSVFVAPVGGIYHFDGALALDGGDADRDVKFGYLRLIVQRGANKITMAEAEFSPFIRNTYSQELGHASFSKSVKLIAYDIVSMEVHHLSEGVVKIWVYGASPHFSGFLVVAD